MSKILFVFEGEKTEPHCFKTFKNSFPLKGDIVSVFGNNIYQLYDMLNKDKDLDLFEILKERKLRKNSDCLTHIRRLQISEIYLFFDSDFHADSDSVIKLDQMFDLFCNETENGKLYISYPMVEALGDEAGCITADLDKTKYKQNIKAKRKNVPWGILNGTVSEDTLQKVCLDHLKKANHIVNGCFEVPESASIDQGAIYKAQVTNFIPKQQVAAVSAFPLFVDDYFKPESLFYRN